MLKGYLHRLLERIKEAIGRFPETLFLCALSGGILIYLTHLDYSQDADQIRETLERVLMSLAIGIFSSATLRLICERWLKQPLYRLLSNALVLAIMVGFYWIIPDPLTSLFGWRYGVTLISLVAAFSLVPYWAKEQYYPLGALKLIAEGAITFLYSLVLFLGGAAILFAMEELLGVPVEGDWYGDYAVLIATLFAPTHYLGSLVKDGDDIASYSYSRVFKILLSKIVMPLLIIYTTILYLYFVRLPFIGGLPQGEVANLVMWYSAICLITFFLSSPMRLESRFVEGFSKWMPIAMLIPLTMMFVAIGIRITAYGITVKRYFVVALGVWIALNVIYRIVSTWHKKQILDSALVLSAVGVMILSLYGPWSAYPVSIANQNQLFLSTIEAMGMWDGKAIVPNAELNQDQQQKISEFLTYFRNQHKLSDLKALPKDFNLGLDMEATFGFQYQGYYSSAQNQNYFNIYAKSRGFNYTTQKSAQIYLVDWYASEEESLKKQRETSGLDVSNLGEISLGKEGDQMVVLPFDQILDDYLASINHTKQSGLFLSEKQAQFAHAFEGRNYTFIIENISGYINDSGEAHYDGIQLLLIVE